MLGSRSRRTLSPPTSAAASAAAISVSAGAVDGRRIAPLVAHRHAGAERGADALGDAADRRFERVAHRRIERAGRAAQHDLSGMTFQVSPPWICVTLTTAPSQRVDVAAGDRLQPVDDLRRGDDRVDAEMRHRRMRAAAGDGDLEDVEGGHHRPGPDRELPGRQPRPVVHAVDRLDRVAVEHALLDHQPGAALVLLGRLKDEMHRAGEIARLGEVLRGAEQHRGVAVMAAGMHPAVVLRGVREAVLLLDRQRIHVGAQRDRAAARARDPCSVPMTPVRGDAALDRRCRTIRAAAPRCRRCGAPRTRSPGGHADRAATPSCRPGNRRCG